MFVKRKTDYGIRAMLYLTMNASLPCPVAEVALSVEVPEPVLAQILHSLRLIGLVRSVRGARGGYTLARPASEISLLEVLTAIQGPIYMNECAVEATPCNRAETCPVHGVWTEFRQELERRLSSTTLSGLAEEKRNLTQPILQS